MRAIVRMLSLCAVLAPLAAAQESPFVPPAVYQALAGEISGDISYDHLRHLTLHHSPNGASRGFRDKMRWIAEKAKQVGLEDVRIIELNFSGVGWSPLRADLWIVAPDKRRLIGYEETAVAIADYSRSGTWEGELVDVGEGTRNADYEGKDVKGKIVLASGGAGRVMDLAVWQRGALGVVSYNTSRGVGYPDQISWTRLTARPPEGKQNTFAFSISYRMAMELKRRLAERPGPGEQMRPGEKITLRAEVETEVEENPKQWIVEGWIRGADRSLPAVLLTAHGQEEKTSANDDNSGCANLLEIGRAVTKLIREGRLARPRRDIRFWWVNEFAAQYEFFSAYPDERKNFLLNINQDMVGAKQSAGSRVQHLSRLPWSRASVLETVFESIGTMVIQGNTGALAASQAGSPQPFSKPIVSKLGTRERYGAEIVPYFDNTDHHAFNDNIIGVPGVTLTNWPDDFIHSSDDDLWQMDATQLQRNAFIAAATAWYFAAAGPAELPALTAQVNAAALRAMSGAAARATEMVLLAPEAERAAAFHDGLNLITQTAARHAATFDSIRALGVTAVLAARIDEHQAALTELVADYLRDGLGIHYEMVTGQARPDTPAATEEEKQLAAKVAEVAASVRDYLEKRRGLGSFGLHQLMAFEAWNYVDGRRSYLDIYRAVRAQAQAAGEWYYGRVTAKQVADLLDAGVKAGVLRLK